MIVLLGGILPFGSIFIEMSVSRHVRLSLTTLYLFVNAGLYQICWVIEHIK